MPRMSRHVSSGDDRDQGRSGRRHDRKRNQGAQPMKAWNVIRYLLRGRFRREAGLRDIDAEMKMRDNADDVRGGGILESWWRDLRFATCPVIRRWASSRCAARSLGSTTCSRRTAMCIVDDARMRSSALAIACV